MFDYDLSDDLKESVAKLLKKDPVMASALKKKMDEITACDETEIEHYPDSSYQWAGAKHVHIASSFVLFFRVFRKEKHVRFLAIMHHDKAFRR